jgi:hypothetical protein
MNLEDFKRATIAQVNELGGFWTFTPSGTTTLSNFNVTTSIANIKIIWSDGTPPDNITSGQNISHIYTL